jgi:hypothetical protein
MHSLILKEQPQGHVSEPHPEERPQGRVSKPHPEERPQGRVSKPHPEERPQGRVSKDGRTHRTRRSSFETLASQAPQDEV